MLSARRMDYNAISMHLLKLSMAFWYCVQVSEATEQTCVNSKGYGFKGCSQNAGILSGLVKQVTVKSDQDCLRACVNSPGCNSVNVQQVSPPSSDKDCQLLANISTCDQLQEMKGYRYFAKISSFHPCVTKAATVNGAAYIGDNEYTLFFDSTMQRFKLDYGTLYATECPVKLTDYFISWPGPIQAVFKTDYFVVTGPYYVVSDTDKKVHQYMATATQAFPSFFTPWPQSITDFFGAGVPVDVTAVFADLNKFYVCTENDLYTSEHLDNGTVIVDTPPRYTIREFNWQDLTAAAMDTVTKNILFFTGNNYFLYDTKVGEIIGKGIVCTNL